MTWPALHLSRSLDASPEAVAAFAGDPRNLPRWAAGLSAGIEEQDGRWIAESPMGRVEVRFVGPVEAGVLDHEVTLPGGVVVRNALRVLANDEGSEVVFTLFRRPGTPDEEFEADAGLIAADLDRLAALLDG